MRINRMLMWPNPARFARGAFVAYVLALGVAPRLLAAQAQSPGKGVIAGVVVDKDRRSPVVRADVILSADSRVTQTDSSGRFTIDAVPAGPTRIVVRAAGFPVSTFELTVRAGETSQPVISLDTAQAGQELPKVAVTAPLSRGPRYVDFERRVKTGRGQYLTSDDLKKGGFSNLMDAIRTLRGVNVECGGGGGCFARMVRAPMQCLPEYVVDDRVDNMFGPRTPLPDIEGLEVYTGAADVPGEYAGRNAGCGVIVIWTKSGPPRKRP